MKREDELIKAGWERRFIACEPRLSEIVEMYEEIGLKVHLEPLPTKEEMETEGTKACTDQWLHCMFRCRQGTLPDYIYKIQRKIFSHISHMTARHMSQKTQYKDL